LAPSSLFSSKLAPPLLKFAIPPSFQLCAESYFLGSGVEYHTQYFLAPLGFALDVVGCVLHSQVCPSSRLLSPESLRPLLILVRHGHQVPPYDLSASCILRLLHVHLPFYDLVIRHRGMIPFQNQSFSKWLAGQGQIYDGFALTIVPRPVVSGLIIISNYQPVLINDFFAVYGFPPVCAHQVVLATGPGKPPAFRVWIPKTGRFGSRHGQKPDYLTLGGPNPDPYPSTRGFRRVWLDPSVPISISAFRISHLWSHSDMLLWIVKHWHWYCTLHFQRISRLDLQRKHTHAPNHILKMSVNRASTIFGLASSVIWVELDHKHPQRRIWQPL